MAQLKYAASSVYGKARAAYQQGMSLPLVLGDVLVTPLPLLEGSLCFKFGTFWSLFCWWFLRALTLMSLDWY